MSFNALSVTEGADMISDMVVYLWKEIEPTGYEPDINSVVFD